MAERHASFMRALAALCAEHGVAELGCGCPHNWGTQVIFADASAAPLERLQYANQTVSATLDDEPLEVRCDE